MKLHSLEHYEQINKNTQALLENVSKLTKDREDLLDALLTLRNACNSIPATLKNSAEIIEDIDSDVDECDYVRSLATKLESAMNKADKVLGG